MFDTMHRESSSLLGCPTVPKGPLMKRSKSIPIKAGGHLDCQAMIEQDQELDADWRDYVVFHRIATGITKMQQETTSSTTRRVNDMCLANIIGTRNLSDDELMRADGRRLVRSERGGDARRLIGPTSMLPMKSDGFAALRDEPSASLKSMLLRSYGRQDNLFYLSSLPDRRQPNRSPSSPPSVDDEAIFDLEL
jgi:hypothetical protein